MVAMGDEGFRFAGCPVVEGWPVKYEGEFRGAPTSTGVG